MQLHNFYYYGRYQNNEYAFILLKVIWILCLTLDKWRPSFIIWPCTNDGYFDLKVHTQANGMFLFCLCYFFLSVCMIGGNILIDYIF